MSTGEAFWQSVNHSKVSPQIHRDLAWRNGWRVTLNVLTGRCFLTDPADAVLTVGDEADCLAAFDRRADAMGPVPERLVICTHGLGLVSLTRRLGAMTAAFGPHDLPVMTMRYPSPTGSLDDHAAAVAGILRRLPGLRHLALVGHSMGGLVIRSLLGRTDLPPDLSVEAVVMIGTPNRGANLADRVANLPKVRTIMGGARNVLPASVANLHVPVCPTLLIVGATGHGWGYNPFLGADNDGLVRVDEADLPGAATTMQVRCDHFHLPENPEVVAATVAFVNEKFAALRVAPA